MEKLLQYTNKDFQDITMDEWLIKKDAALQPLVAKWFDEIKSCGADVEEIFHDNCPMGCVQHTPFAYVNAFTSHINLGFFYGAFLIDKNRLLEGEGKRMRHVKIKPGFACNETGIKSLIREAYSDIKKRLNGK